MLGLCYGITPEYLLYALSHKIVASEAANKVFIDTTLPNIADRWKEIKIPVPQDREMLELLTAKMAGIIKNQWTAQAEIEGFKENHDIYAV